MVNSVSPSSKLLSLRVVLETLRTASGVRGDHDLVDYSHPPQLANLCNTHQQQCLEKDKSECLGYSLAMTRKAAGFLSQASSTLFFPNIFPSILLSTFFLICFFFLFFLFLLSKDVEGPPFESWRAPSPELFLKKMALYFLRTAALWALV